MKKILFIISFILISIAVSAQKQVRKEIRTGNKAYNEQRYETAQEHYQKALEANAGSKEASFNLADTYYKQQQWDNALKEFQHYLTVETEKTENMSGAWRNIGNTYLKKKANESKQTATPQQGQQQEDNLQMSLEAYKKALRLNPKDDEARYNLAVVQKMIKDNQQNNQNKQDKQDKQNKEDKKDKQDQKDKQQDKQNNQDKQNQDQQREQQQQDQMSQQNIEQILNAIGQDERDTQDRVQKQKAKEHKMKNQDNRRQNKDW